MTSRDLDELDGLLALASAVVPLRDVRGAVETRGDIIALRHDVDDNPGSLDAATRIAAWEFVRGYRSTFFILPTAYYWNELETPGKLRQIAALGHEIGLHANPIVESIATGLTPEECLREDLGRLDEWGHDVVGVAPHGDPSCYWPNGELRFVNDEVFEECSRPELGTLASRGLDFEPRRLAEYGLSYEAYRLPRGFYLSDSGDRWAPSIAEARSAFEAGLDAPLQILQHPDWYRTAL